MLTTATTVVKAATPDAQATVAISAAGQSPTNDVTFNQYDAWNQLVKTTVGGNSVTYTYSGDGLRASKTVNSQTKRYLYEYDHVVLEVDGQGNESARNVYGTNLLKRTDSGNSYYYMYNGHGDVTALLTTTGQIPATYYYDAFGNIIEQTVTGGVYQPVKYAGYYFDDETGLYYLNARYYDPKIARFLSEDTNRGNQRDPLSLNLYTYVHNEPIMYVDPSGNKDANLRDLVEAVGGKISWDGSSKTATAKVNGKKLKFSIGKSTSNTIGLSFENGHFVIDNRKFNDLFSSRDANVYSNVASDKVTVTIMGPNKLASGSADNHYLNQKPTNQISGRSGGNGTYIVKSGDTLSEIAQRNGTTVKAIADANGISNVNLIRAGQALIIPGSGKVNNINSKQLNNTSLSDAQKLYGYFIQEGGGLPQDAWADYYISGKLSSDIAEIYLSGGSDLLPGLFTKGSERVAVAEGASLVTTTDEILLVKSAKAWGVLEDGTNQGIKHFMQYWDELPDRIPSIAKRLGIDPSKFAKTAEGFENFTTEIIKAINRPGVVTRELEGKTLYFVNGAEKGDKGVTVIVRNGQLQSVMPSDLKSFMKMK